ncbi:putative methyltransferase [Prauserella marina]|uniref:Predicted methyltransferase n=1 Tax=Prauserella marina TaxID=530584 RepID=A0A222W0K4_9PSEU|nr:putative methyltransferase [Prauserella marina]PWV73091.1 putative methyltransferase [Prauserella marina]SDD72088.1 Predicted methyltransferase [Prauserella marina]
MSQAFGISAPPLRLAITLLSSGWRDLDELVSATAAPRRSVEDLLTALDGDLEKDGAAMRLREDAVDRYRELATPPADPGEEVAAKLAALVEDVPAALPALDHVQATPDTALRRASWLAEQYDLRSARLLFLGDHDLTSLAVRAVAPSAHLTVVDVDDRVLEYIDRHGDRSIRTVHADLRFGLPLAVAGSSDVVFSDPPYTREGMGLFASRGIECLAEPQQGRLVLAYGYSVRHPALGHQVQLALTALGLTFEAIIPNFNRYTGAQAIGSAADLYVCQPTARSGKQGKVAKQRKGQRPGIYTHGPQSVEARETPAALREALLGRASETGLPVEERGIDWTTPSPVPEGTAVAIDLSADPGPWLLRVLLGFNATRLALLLPNAHPDLGNAKAQAALTELVAGKYRLTLRRSTPDNKHAIVVADAIPAGDEKPAVHTVFSRAHGRLGNLWQQAPSDIAGLRLVDLPRHRIAEVQAALRR